MDINHNVIKEGSQLKIPIVTLIAERDLLKNLTIL